MITPVRDVGRWWADWQRLGDDERLPLLATLEEQVRGHFPPSTEVYRRFLSCYPRHALLRFSVPSEHGLRDGFAFYAAGQLYPLDWSLETLMAFNEVALELKGAKDAEEYLRFATSASAVSNARFFIVEDAVELRLQEGTSLTPEIMVPLQAVLRPFEMIPKESEGEAYRFQGSILHRGVVQLCELAVGPTGAVTQDNDASVPPVVVPVVPDGVESDRFFVLVRETSLTAERFVRRVRSGPVHQARVGGPVRLQGEVFTEAVTLSQITFEHGLDLRGARFEKGLTLEQCVIEGQLSLRDAHVQGSLQASGLWFHREGGHHDHEMLRKDTRWGVFDVDLEASGLRVDGSIYLEGLKTHNLVDLSRVTVQGDLRLGGSRIGKPRADSSDRVFSETPEHRFFLRLDAAHIEGDLDFVYARDTTKYGLAHELADEALDESIPGYSTPMTKVRGSIQATRLRVGGEVSMPGLRCEGDIWLTGCAVEGDLAADAPMPHRRCIVLGSLALGGAKIGGYVGLHGMYCGEDLQFFSSAVGRSVFSRTPESSGGRIPPLRVKGQFDLSGMRTDDVDLEAADIGELRCITGEIGRLRIGPGVVHAAEEGAENTEGGQAVRQQSARFGKLELWDLTVRKRLAIRAEIAGDAELGNIDCGGDVEFWNDRVTEESLSELLTDGERWAADGVPQPFGERTVIGGDLKCTGLEIGGRLMLTNVETNGRILFKNCQIGQDLNCSSVGPDPTSGLERTRTRCAHLDLELTRCGGDADLAGLDVVDGGSVHARQLHVSGRILFARPLGEHRDYTGAVPDDRDKRVQARVDGDLDLSVAEAGQLVLAASSFGGTVNLERGSFRRLDLVEPSLLEAPNLSDIRVDRWEVADEHLVTLLNSSQPFARATYVAIEKMLRNKAQDADADGVYRAMRARAIQEVKDERSSRLEPATTEPDHEEPDHEESTREESTRAEMPGKESPWTRAAASSSYLQGLFSGAAAPVSYFLRTTSSRLQSLFSRAASPVSYFLRTTGSRLQGLFYGWGTYYWAPLLVFSILFVPTTWWTLGAPANVTPSAELMAASGVAGPEAYPSDVGVDWGRSDGFWLMVRYHVPVIPLTARSEFRPAQRPWMVSVPGVAWFRLAFTAESYAFMVYLVSWILWPLFLVGLGRRIVRETT